MNTYTLKSLISMEFFLFFFEKILPNTLYYLLKATRGNKRTGWAEFFIYYMKKEYRVGQKYSYYMKNEIRVGQKLQNS